MSTSSVRTDAWLAALLIAVVCLISWPGMQAPKLLDDQEQMEHVAAFDSWRQCFGTDCYDLFRPVKNLAFYALREASPLTCHLFTLATYLLAGLGVYILLRRLLGPPMWAFAGALLWATSPTHASTAVWLSAFNLSLALALSCACIFCHDVARSVPGRRISLSVLACVLLLGAQLTYETAVAVPGLCLLVDLLRRRSVFSREAIARFAALGLITLGFLIIRARFGATHSIEHLNSGFSPDLKAWQLSLSAPWFMWKHFAMWLMPVGRLEFCSTYIWGRSASMVELAAAWVWLLASLGIACLLWRRLPLAAIGILWFFAAGFPPSNFIPVWSGPIEDYYLIFPSVGLVLILLGCSRALMEWMRRATAQDAAARRYLCGGVLVVGGLWRLAMLPLFWLQTDLWNQPLKLYLMAEASRPHQFQLQIAIAREWLRMGRLDEAREQATRAHQSGPWSPASCLVLGCIALEQRDFAGAEPFLRECLGKSIEGSPIHDFALLHLAKAAVLRGAEADEVRALLRPLLENTGSSQHRAAIDLLIDFYLQRGLPEDALRAAQKALQLHPQDEALRQRVESMKH